MEGGKFYTKLNNQNSDYRISKINKAIEGRDVVFENKLPVEMIVVLETRPYANIRALGTMLPHGRLVVSDTEINDGDLVHFQYFRDNERFFVCPSHKMVKLQGTLYVGTVATVPGIIQRDIHPGGDVSSINVHNMLPWPLVISIGDIPVMRIQPNIDLGSAHHHGDLTVSPSVYFDNLNQGIKLGTFFRVHIERGGKLEYLYGFTIDDIDANHIFIGDVSPQVDSQIATEATIKLANISRTGRSIYRIGTSGPYTGMYTDAAAGVGTVMPKNHAGTDMHRNSVGNSSRSTNPNARYKMLSRSNVVSMCDRSKVY
jgi:hypothetical protein